MKISIVVISKDETKLSATLAALESHIDDGEVKAKHQVDLTVVDASEGRLDHIRKDFPNVKWIDFEPPYGVRVSIPHQRNHGIRASDGEIIVFTDAGCLPHDKWLLRLIEPIVDGSERMTCGPSWIGNNVYSKERGSLIPKYVKEAATINLAFTRELAMEIGDFDQRFEYGSDIDFTRRAIDAGARIRFVADAIVEHDWGSFWRQLKRSRQYGSARIRLSMKHSRGVISRVRSEPVPVVYAFFIIGLPLALRFRKYLLLLAIPLWRARKRPYPVRVIISHLAEGVGGLQEMTRIGLRYLSLSDHVARNSNDTNRDRSSNH